MKIWALVLSVIGASLAWIGRVAAQEVWADTGNSYSLSGPNALTRSTLLDRQEKLQNKCEQSSERELTRDPELFKNLLVDDQHKLLYCYVPKVACTNWKRVLMVATGKWKKVNSALEIPAALAHAIGTFQRLSNFEMAEIEDRLATYNKLIVVRHPFERLLSAYRNKFEAKNEKSSSYFQSRFGRKIIKKYRRNPSTGSLLLGDDVTFREFVDFIVDNDNENGTRNEHWQSITDLCHPCLVNYNLVSKYETLVEDATEILERIGVDSVTFPSRPRNVEPTENILDKYYSTLSYGQLRDLAKLYHRDFYLFDYSVEKILGFSIA
ncbi:hypothetical protein TKK_0002199 [Trichogramma kaykai]|uniref:Carbohydrate sulfotransferase n=1 Tax=Trichogramma kaykai TaxID=54128 RepID=A0ABD2XBN3_9HYME